MSATTLSSTDLAATATTRRPPALGGALRGLIARRLALTLRTPRAILLPLATPVLIAVVMLRHWRRPPALSAGSTT